MITQILAMRMYVWNEFLCCEAVLHIIISWRNIHFFLATDLPSLLTCYYKSEISIAKFPNWRLPTTVVRAFTQPAAREVPLRPNISRQCLQLVIRLFLPFLILLLFKLLKCIIHNRSHNHNHITKAWANFVIHTCLFPSPSTRNTPCFKLLNAMQTHSYVLVD